MFFIISGVDAYHAQVAPKAKVIMPLKTQFYGMREFAVTDPDGHIITSRKRVASDAVVLQQVSGGAAATAEPSRSSWSGPARRGASSCSSRRPAAAMRCRPFVGPRADARPGSWLLRGRFAWAAEATPIFAQTAPAGIYGFGFAPVVWRWNFEPRPRWSAFGELSMGGLWTTDPIPEDTSRANFTAHWGGGVRLRSARPHALLLGYRFQHISNGNQLGSNPGVNSHVVLAGWSQRDEPSGPTARSSPASTTRQLDQVAHRILRNICRSSREAAGAAVADRRAQVPQDVLDDRPHRSARRHAHLGAFRAERFDVDVVVVFDVEAIANRLDRRHAAQHLERHLHRPLLIGQHHRLLHDLAGRFLGAGEHAAEHHGVAAEEQRLEDRAVAPDAAVGDERHAVLAGGLPAFDQRLQLRHAEAGGDAASCSRRRGRCRP